VLRVIWWKMNTCGNEGKQQAVLGKTAVMMLTWTVAAAVFDALDIFATILYDVESPAGYFSAGFSFLSVWYGLVQRKNDLIVVAQIGAKHVDKSINVAQELANKTKKLTILWKGNAPAGASGQSKGAKAAREGTFARPSLKFAKRQVTSDARAATADAGGKSRKGARLPKMLKSLRTKRSSSAAGKVEIAELVANDPVVEMTEVVAQADVANPASGGEQTQAALQQLQQHPSADQSTL
jgi:hypothetical protein